jgi:hypothetical protein
VLSLFEDRDEIYQLNNQIDYLKIDENDEINEEIRRAELQESNEDEQMTYLQKKHQAIIDQQEEEKYESE